MDLRLCQTLGISHSHWLGGRAQWTDLDRDKARAFALYEAELCPRCQTLRDDWHDDDGDPLREPVWVPEHSSCPGCGVFRQAEDRMTEAQRKAGGFVTFVPLAYAVAKADR